MMRKPISTISNYYDYLLVAGGLISVYFLVTLPLDYLQSVNSSMFWSPDAQSYRSVANWITGNSSDSAYVLIRPVLYPLIIVIGRAIANNYGIWGIQFLMWIISGLLLFKLLKTASRNTYLRALGMILYTGNITLMLLTLHALTEVTAIFLITCLVAWISQKKVIEPNLYWLGVLFILSFIVLVRPLFITIWLFLLLYRIVAFIYSRIKSHLSWKYLIFILIAILPIVGQASLMEIKFDQFTVSDIGSATLKQYLFASVYGAVNKISLETARSETISSTQENIYIYLFTHLGRTIEAYITNIARNFISHSNFVNYPTPNAYLSAYMRLVNIGYSLIQLVMIPISIVVLIQLFKNRSWNEFYIFISLLILLFVVFASSGITFGQGDRILLPSLPIWIILYCMDISWLMDYVKAKKNATGNTLAHNT